MNWRNGILTGSPQGLDAMGEVYKCEQLLNYSPCSTNNVINNMSNVLAVDLAKSMWSTGSAVGPAIHVVLRPSKRPSVYIATRDSKYSLCFQFAIRYSIIADGRRSCYSCTSSGLHNSHFSARHWQRIHLCSWIYHATRRLWKYCAGLSAIAELSCCYQTWDHLGLCACVWWQYRPYTHWLRT